MLTRHRLGGKSGWLFGDDDAEDILVVDDAEEFLAVENPNGELRVEDLPRGFAHDAVGLHHRPVERLAFARGPHHIAQREHMGAGTSEMKSRT
ncbi:hypothetical protein AHiyo8_07780 [Arthrobacter sp. Hiyo8]|nr:hypothetical protein AHiyo8_07780 [Arthrobacter sp. Hiyo8]